MKQDNILKLSDENFRRMTGVKRGTFEKMTEIITTALILKKARGGRPNMLNPEGMILMTLEYLREYRTYASVALNYGISESNAYKIIKWIEETLIRDGSFKLPPRKEPLRSEIEVVLIDVTESPIERPKKNKKNITLARKKDIR